MISNPYPAQSVLPSKCRITYERRLVPGDTLEQVKAEFERCCREAEVEATIELATAKVKTPTGRFLHSSKWYAPWECPLESPFVQASLAALESVGLQNGVSAYQFCTNAAFTAGIRTLPTVGFGPSRESLAHVVDEYIEIEALIAARRGYEAIASRMLDRDDPL
jgi:acetylornithine deacetylase/succinyl-diaminopimelate desuccinylase-like protein